MSLDWLRRFKISRYEGYQCFKLREGRLYPISASHSYESAFSREDVPVNVWQEDKNNYELECRFSKEKYLTGFHLFPTMEEAEFFVKLKLRGKSPISVRKVIFSGVTAKGYIANGLYPIRVIVARERYVCS